MNGKMLRMRDVVVVVPLYPLVEKKPRNPPDVHEGALIDVHEGALKVY